MNDSQSEGATTPRYEHDCAVCRSLGQWKQYDLYFCEKQAAGPTVIARYGVGGDYLSGMGFAGSIPALGEAKRRADRLIEQQHNEAQANA